MPIINHSIALVILHIGRMARMAGRKEGRGIIRYS